MIYALGGSKNRLFNSVKQKQPGRLKRFRRSLKKDLKKLRQTKTEFELPDTHQVDRRTYEEVTTNPGGHEILEEDDKTVLGDEIPKEEVVEEEVPDIEVAFASVQYHEKIKKRKQHYCNDGDDIVNDEDYYQSSLINDESESDDISTPPPREKKTMKIQELRRQHITLSDQILSADLRGRIWCQLNDCNFDKFFDSKWTIDSSILSTLKFRVEDFIVFLHSKNENRNINVVHLVTDFLRNNISLYNEYCLQLSEVQKLSPCTVRNYSDNLVKFLEWFALYRKKDTNKKVKQVRPMHWELLLKMVKQIQKRVRRQIKAKQSDNTIEALIERQEWPKGGLLELQNAIRSEMDWVYNLARANSIPTNKTIYNRYMNLLSASIYCFSCQGRIGAIEDLKFFQGAELLTEGVVLTSKFKTSAKFGYQPVTLPADKASTFLLHFYLTNVRPRTLQARDDPLFINFTGSGPFKVAKGLNNFFAQTLSLKITSTRIRAIVETNFQDLVENGSISSLQKHAISNVNGHDGATTRDYYLKRRRCSDAKNASDAFDIFDQLNGVTENFSDYEFEDIVDGEILDNAFLIDDSLQLSLPSADADATAAGVAGVAGAAAAAAVNSTEVVPHQVALKGVVGCKHPEFNKSENQMRAVWTEYEINFVGNWCEENKLSHPEWAKCIISKCTSFIKSNMKIREHFHQLHIFDSSRLRHGWEQYKLKKERGTRSLNSE